MHLQRKFTDMFQFHKVQLKEVQSIIELFDYNSCFNSIRYN